MMKGEEDIDQLIINRCGKVNPFSTPEGYFADLYTSVRAEVKLPKLPGNAFFVPENYWEEMASQIQSRVAIETDRQNGFDVPKNYFESLESLILSKNHIQKKQPIIRRLFTGNVWKYATAACITIALGLTFWSQQTSTYNVQSELSNLPANDIEQYLEENTNSADMNMLIENIDHDMRLNVSTAQIDQKTLSDYIETQL